MKKLMDLEGVVIGVISEVSDSATTFCQCVQKELGARLLSFVTVDGIEY